MKISIITVVYNNENTIANAIESVLSQDYPEIEYIIIDGKSTDDTLKIIEKYRQQITIVVSEKDSGIYDAMNKGIQLATGDVIGILNSDDFYVDKNVISNVAKAMQQDGADVFYADLNYVDATDTQKIIRKWKSGKVSKKSFYFGWMPPHPTVFLKSEVYKKVGLFNLKLRSAADYEILLRIFVKNNYVISYLPKTIINMRVGGMSNASFANRIKANKEDRNAWKINEIKPYFFTLYLKPLRKIIQYINFNK